MAHDTPRTGEAPPRPLRTTNGPDHQRTPGVLAAALRRALGGGLYGAVAMVLQVLLLMWLRTTVNYQMRNGGTMLATMRLLYREGGVGRFYSGASVALLQGPLSRFGDTAANAGVLALLERTSVPVAAQTVLASLAAAAWRLVLSPLDTVKTVLQVQGGAGFGRLAQRVRDGGALELWSGSLGAMLATFVGHYPWFATNNCLERAVPGATTRLGRLARRAAIGFASSLVSDFASNSTRVVKTYVQTSEAPISYADAVVHILATEGLAGLLWRGLLAKLIANGIQSVLFSVVWKMMLERSAAASSSSSKHDAAAAAAKKDDDDGRATPPASATGPWAAAPQRRKAR